jgi:hypothetical protein
MSKKRLDMNWKREKDRKILNPAVKRYRRCLEDKGLRISSRKLVRISIANYMLRDGNIIDELVKDAGLNIIQIFNNFCPMFWRESMILAYCKYSVKFIALN